MLLHLDSKEVVDLCIESETKLSYAPVWSPDERYIALFIQSPIDQSENVILIDLEANTGMYLDTNSIPIGWILDS